MQYPGIFRCFSKSKISQYDARKKQLIALSSYVIALEGRFLAYPSVFLAESAKIIDSGWGLRLDSDFASVHRDTESVFVPYHKQR